MREAMDGTYRRFKWLVFGYLVSTGISAGATIFLARIMGPEIYGIYAAAIMLPFLFVGLADLGVGSAVTYYMSSLKGDESLIGSYFRTALLFVVIFVATASMSLFFAASFIARVVFNKEVLTKYIQVSGFIVIYIAVGSVCNGALLSIYCQKSVGVFYISNSIIRNALSVYLFLLTRDPYYAVLGQTIGFVATVSVYLIYTVRKIPPGNIDTGLLRRIVTYGMPYGMGLFIMTLCVQFYNVFAARSLSISMYGNFSAAWLILSGVMLIPSSFSQSLFPSLSEQKVGTHVDPSAAFNSAVKIASSMFLYLWITFGGMADIIVELIYGSKYNHAGSIFTMLSMVFILSVFGWGIINPLLLSIKKTKVLAVINLVSVVISLLVIDILLYMHVDVGVWSIPLAFFVLHASITFLGLAYLKKEFGIRLSVRTIVKAILIVVILFKLSKYLCDVNINLKVTIGVEIDLAPILKVIIGFVGVGIVYLMLLIIMRVITREDYEILKDTLFSFPILRRILGFFAEPAFSMSERLNGFVYKLNRTIREKAGSITSR